MSRFASSLIVFTVFLLVGGTLATTAHATVTREQPITKQQDAEQQDAEQQDTGNQTSRRSFSRSTLRRLVAQVALEHGMESRLIDAVVQVESDYNPYAVSRKGAVGLMQLMPSTVRRLRVADPFDPVQNLRGGVREFARLLDYYAGDLHLTLAAYNAGQGAVARYDGIPPFRETRDYIVRILSLYNGRPYRLAAISRRPPPQVRLLRNPTTGEVLITNDAATARRTATRPAVILGGGFGKR